MLDISIGFSAILLETYPSPVGPAESPPKKNNDKAPSKAFDDLQVDHADVVLHLCYARRGDKIL